MTNETKNRIHAYMAELPHMKEKVFGALLMLAIAAGVVVTSTYAWVTLSRAPEVSEIATTLAANGALEIALSNEAGTIPSELDIDESAPGNASVLVSNLQWGNLVNLSDPAYGIDHLDLRPAQLNTTGLLTNPLWGAVYGGDGRITNLDTGYAYAKYNGSQFLTSNEYGVRAIATYRAEISDATQQAYNDRVQAVVTAQTNVYQTYSAVAPKFSALGTMISKYAQNKLDDGYTDLAPYLADMIPLYHAVRDAMEKQMDAYVALANLQNYLYTNKVNGTFVPLTWDNLKTNKAQYNTAKADAVSSNGYISLVGLTQFIADYDLLQKDISHLEMYHADYQDNRSPYYWGGYRMDGETKVPDNSVSGFAMSNIVAHLIDYSSMTIDLDNNGTETKVTALGMDNAGSLMGANGEERKVYAHNGILYRLEQNAIKHEYRINGNAACTIKVQYVMSITVYGKAYTKASGPSYFEENFAASLSTELVPNDAVAEDTYGMAIDLWVRTNAEETCLTLEGATSTDLQGNIVSYDGINRIWGATGEASLTTDSTTQGGGSCYIYYADTPEDMARSLDLLDAMKVAFVSSTGELLATAEMDTANYWAVNGRITVPLVLDNQTQTTYVFTDAQNVEQIGRAVTTLYTDIPVRITAIVYLDGTRLTNDNVLASAEIQGSLNIQFGSSVDLKTAGDKELIDDVRTVTATVDPNKLDYDTATSDADMTTSVTVNIEGQGAEPDVVTAFFVRAINSTQGSREPAMTFTKQANGSWKCDYLFTSPGTYYLRQVRLDGVDYTLANPQKVEVAGFGLSSVSWSEIGNTVTVRTSESSHATTVTIQFSSDDRSKMPASVQARFVRDDGNTVNIPLTYNASGNWVGTGTFSASGEYELQYLVADGRYIDLALSDGTYRTMDLSLGMYVSVSDLSGGVREEYEEGKTYPKNVAVRVYNNAGAQMEALEGLTLYYSNGASLTNTINTILEWDELNGYYTGTLPIVRPGRYQFASVTMTGNYLGKCTSSPVYTIISPDPPIFDASSACGQNDADGIQFVPLTNDAKIDGIRIANADSARASAVVYSEVSGEYYTVALDGGSVSLPTYNGEQIGTDAEGKPVYKQEQDGQWSVAAIRLWDCYDGNSNFREETDPILWVASGTLGQNYLNTLTGEDAVTADATQDFSKLTTNVSAKVNVTMNPGTTALGGTSVPFGSTFPVSGIGMSVTLTDGAGRIIPKDKIGDVTLNVRYSGNSDTAYGYKVSGYSVPYTILLNNQDAESGARTVSSNESWNYVGRYTVQSLTVAIGSETLTYSNSSGIGVPAAYTLTTAAPTAANVALDENSVKQTVKTFGGTADNVTGTFLQAHNLDGTNVTIRLTGAGGQDMRYAVIDGLSVKLLLTHQNNSQTYGGYTFTGDTGYQNLTLAMNEKTAGSGIYYAPTSQALLAGTYKAQMQITIGSEARTVNLDNITVRSMLPDVKITGVSPTTEVTVSANANPSTNHLTANSGTLFTATNRYDTANGRWAVVYMGYEAGAAGFTHQENCSTAESSGASYDNYVNYTQPTIRFTMSNGGTGTANINVEGIGTGSVQLTSDQESEPVTVGTITEGDTDWLDKHTGAYLITSCYCKYTYEKATLLGTKTIETVTSIVGNATITRTLANPITISQPSQENPTLKWSTNGVTIKVSDGANTYSQSSDFPFMTELTATVTANNGYHHPKLTQPEGVSNWTIVREGEIESVYTFRMSMGNTTLSGSATKYPAITFSNANNATVAVTVDGTAITSNTGAKAGAQVAVTVTRTGNYCLPKLTQPTGVTGWTANEGDFVSTYTFTMPAQAVSLAAPTTTAMHTVTWTDTGKRVFSVVDESLNQSISNGGYVVPGHTLTIRVDAAENSGGINPALTSPNNATETKRELTWATYSYTMPNSAVTLDGTVEGYPELILGKSYTGSLTITVLDGGIERTDHTTNDAGSVAIKPGNKVEITLTAANGYYNPRMTKPDGVTNWTANEGDFASMYTFTMPNGDVVVSGKISVTAAVVTYNANGGSCSTASQTYAGTALTLPTPDSRTGYTFLGWYTAASGGTKVGGAGASYTPTQNITLYAQWEQINYTITVETSGATVTGVTNGQTAHYGDTITIKVTFTKSVKSVVVNDGKTDLLNKTAAGTYSFTMPASDVSIKATSFDLCVTGDTLVTLADGTRKEIQCLSVGETVVAWNFYTGKYENVPISLLQAHGAGVQNVLHLYFEDGTELKLLGEHGVFDADLDTFVFIDEDDVGNYIGHSFVKQDGEGFTTVKLVDYEVTTEYTTAYTILSYSHYNVMAEGMFTVTPAHVGDNFFNPFDVGEDMKYDEEAVKADIEKYGLYAYEDFDHVLTYEQFEALNIAHFKVSVGKGYITYDGLIYLIENFINNEDYNV